MRNPENEDQPELQWLENLIEWAIAVAGDIVVGVAMTFAEAVKWSVAVLTNEPPTPPSAE